MADLNTNTEQLTSINEQKETWHREIDNILVIRTLKFYIKTGPKHVDFIKKQEDEINHTISEITYTFGELKN